MTSTRLTAPMSIKKSDAHIELAVLPVPCSLKQNALFLVAKKDAVSSWCLNGLKVPGYMYERIPVDVFFNTARPIFHSFF